MSDVSMEDRARALENEFFRRRENELIEKMRARLASEGKESSQAACPKCDGKLVETNYEDIKIDVCDTCHGVWLDAGELAHIMHKDENTGWFGRLFS